MKYYDQQNQMRKLHVDMRFNKEIKSNQIEVDDKFKFIMTVITASFFYPFLQ